MKLLSELRHFLDPYPEIPSQVFRTSRSSSFSVLGDNPSLAGRLHDKLPEVSRIFGELKEQQYRIHPGEFCGRRVWTDPLGWAFVFHSCEYSTKDTHAEEALKIRWTRGTIVWVLVCLLGFSFDFFFFACFILGRFCWHKNELRSFPLPLHLK